MCTSIAMRGKKTYLGRNLDVDFSFSEKVVITPRKFSFEMCSGEKFGTKFSMIGMAAVLDKYPLYYDAVNEKGLYIAGLNFPDNAVYGKAVSGKINVALFELIPFVLGQCACVDDAVELFKKINLTDDMYLGKIPSTPLHFMLSDKTRSVVIEPVSDGMKIYEDKFDVMTNNPTFDYHINNMNNYINLSAKNGENKFSERFGLKNYGVGMGALGLPGDASSASRFVRAAFNLANSVIPEDELGCVSQFFHVLDSVAMVKGTTLTDSGKVDFTLYSCCINADEGIYYYKTYSNSRISAVFLHSVDLDSKDIYVYELKKSEDVLFCN